MLRGLMISLFLALVSPILCKDYFKEATQKGLDYVRQFGIPFLESEIKKMSIPDVSGTTRTPLSDFTYKLSSIKIENLQIKASNMTVDQQTGLSLSFKEIQFEVKTKWDYREKNWPHIKDSGDVDINAKDASLKFIVNLDVHDEAHPLVHARLCILDIGALKLNFNGKISWLYNFFSSKIEKDLKKLVAGEVCQAIVHILELEGDKLLSQAPEIIGMIKSHVLNTPNNS